MTLPPPDAYAAFGARSHVGPGSTVSCPHRIEIGDDVTFTPGAWLSVIEEHAGRRYEPRLRIGNRVWFGRGAVIACIGLVEIGDDVLTGDRVFIGDCYHGYLDPHMPIGRQPMSEPQPVRIGNGAFLGVNSVVLPGVTVGENGYVGAGAIVNGDVPPRSVVAGNPARVIRQWDEATGAWTAPGAQNASGA
jgi:acetyltransferase-like isoleucine patch superfamily enzyme